jgi:hypothetical protein
MAPIAALQSRAHLAGSLLRQLREAELYERAATAADAALPWDSLVMASLLRSAVCARVPPAAGILAAAHLPAQCTDLVPVREAWLRDARAVPLSQRSLQGLIARWRAGSLTTHTPQEAVFFADARWPSGLPGAELLILCASDAVLFWPPASSAAEENARTLYVYCALRAALQLGVRSTRVTTSLALQVLLTLHGLLTDTRLQPYAMGARLQQQRLAAAASCCLEPAEDAALRELEQRVCTPENRAAWLQHIQAADAGKQAAAAADVARHGLRACALPSCGAVEAHPKFFKLCGRCHGVTYCGTAHCSQDWQRHKREDGCIPKPAA